MKNCWIQIAVIWYRLKVSALAGLFLTVWACEAGAASSTHQVKKNRENMEFTITDFYYPYFTAKENVAVLNGMLEKAKITATYRHASSKFRLTSCMTGVVCLPFPHFEDSSTTYRVSIDSQYIPDNTGQAGKLSFLLPRRTSNGYRLAGLEIEMSIQAFSTQESYLALLKRAGNPKSEMNSEPKTQIAYRVWPLSARQENMAYLLTCIPVTTIPFPVPNAGTTAVLHLSGEHDFEFAHDTSDHIGTCEPGVSVLDQALDQPKLPGWAVADTVRKIETRYAKDTQDWRREVSLPTSFSHWQNIYSSKPGDKKAGIYYTQNGSWQSIWIAARDASRDISGEPLLREETYVLFNNKLVFFAGEVRYVDRPDISTVTWSSWFHMGQPAKAVSGIKESLNIDKANSCEHEKCIVNLDEAKLEAHRSYSDLMVNANALLAMRAGAILVPRSK